VVRDDVVREKAGVELVARYHGKLGESLMLLYSPPNWIITHSAESDSGTIANEEAPPSPNPQYPATTGWPAELKPPASRLFNE